MSKYKKKQQKNMETVAESVYWFFRYLLDFCICVYLLLILVVMPFYNQEGYSHIGTDKSTFLRNCIIYGSCMVIPVLLLALIMRFVVYVQEKGLPDKSAMSVKGLLAALRKELSVTDRFAIAFGISVVISYLGSEYKKEALWGALGWYMGMIPQLSAVAVYFLVSRAWKRRSWMLSLVFPVSAVVFLLGYLNRFGIYPIDMQIEHENFISTIGNINWYCGYLVSVFFGGMYLLWQWDENEADRNKVHTKNIVIKYLLAGYVIIGFATMVTQGSNSGIFTLMVMLLVFFCMSAGDGKRMEMFWLEMVFLSAACVITYVLRATGVLTSTISDFMIDIFTGSAISILMTVVSVLFWIGVRRSNKRGCYPKKAFTYLARLVVGISLAGLGVFVILLTVNTAGGGIISKMTPSSLEGVLTFSPEWGSNRGATWLAGWMCFWEQNVLHKLIGVGPDCMAAFIYDMGSPQLVSMVSERFGTARLTNAHNEWLTVLVDMGLLGMVSFVGMITTAIKRFIAHYRDEAGMLAGACGFCLLAYTMNNMFSFEQSMSLATIYIILGIGENFLREKADREAHEWK